MSKVAKTVAIYVDKSSTSTPDYLRIKKSTVFTLTYNAETEDFDYISDETKTTEIKAYAPTIEQDISILPEEPDYEYFNTLRKALPTGADAHKKILLVYLNDGDNTGGYYSTLQDAVVTFTDYNAVDGKINISIAFCGIETKGTSIISAGVPTFTEVAS